MSLAEFIEPTCVKPTATIADIDQLCAEARDFGCPVVVVPPLFVKYAKGLTAGSPVKVSTVIGFPFGYNAIEAKLAETVLAIVDGADELEIVINIIALRNNDWQYLAKEINTILPVAANKGIVCKIIIESGILSRDEIVACCDIYGASGTSFLQTSTGYAERSATVEAVELMRRHLAERVQIKANGEIFDATFARQLLAAGASRIGCEKAAQLINEAAI